MRKEKLDELNEYVELLKTKRKKLMEMTGNFIKVNKYLVELNNGEVITREKILKENSDGNASIILPVTVDGNVILVVQPRVFTSSSVGIEEKIMKMLQEENCLKRLDMFLKILDYLDSFIKIKDVVLHIISLF